MSHNIPIQKIIHDTPMRNWCIVNAQDRLGELKPKKIPKSKDTVGSLKPEKINKIQNAYDLGIEDELPPIEVKKFGNTGYYEVIDGRHRAVMALKNNEETIRANIQTGGNYYIMPKKRRTTKKRLIRKRRSTLSKRTGGAKPNKKPKRIPLLAPSLPAPPRATAVERAGVSTKKQNNNNKNNKNKNKK